MTSLRRPGRRRVVGRLGVASLALAGVGLVAVAALHVLRSDLGPAGHRISEYALGPYGWLMGGAFFAIGGALLSLAGAFLAGTAARRPLELVTAVALATAGVGMVLSGCFRTDAGRSGAATDAAHSLASAGATLALLGAAVAWSLGGPRWDGQRRDRVGSGLVVLAVALGATSPALHRSAWTGISQRALWLTLLAWLVVTAGQVRLRAGPAASCPAESARAGRK